MDHPGQPCRAHHPSHTLAAHWRALCGQPAEVDVPECGLRIGVPEQSAYRENALTLPQGKGGVPVSKVVKYATTWGRANTRVTSRQIRQVP